MASEGRKQFIRENALTLLAERDAKIARQAARIRQLEKTVTGQRLALRQLRTQT